MKTIGHSPLLVIALILTSLLPLGCTRESKTATISITLPQAPAMLKSVSAMSDGSPWSGEITTSSQVNCYLVVVGGPTADLSYNSCKEKSTNVELVRFGPYVGGVPAGQTITLEVPSGKARKISLVAMQAQSGACVSFKGSGPPQGQLSHPRVVDTKTLDLSPGDVNLAFTLPSDLSTLKQVDECQVSDIPNSGGGQATSFWGNGRDGSIAIPNSTAGYVDAITYDTVGMLGSGAYFTPEANGIPGTRAFHYASRITNVDTTTGRSLTLGNDLTSTDQIDAGDIVLWHVSNGWASTNPDSNACGGGLSRGAWGTAKVASVSLATDTVVLEQSISTSPSTINNTNISSANASEGTAHCSLHLVRASQFNSISIGNDASLTFTTWSWTPATRYGGIMAVWIKNLTLANSGSSLNFENNNGGHPGTVSGAYGLSGSGSGAAFENRGGTVSTYGGGGGNGGAGSSGSAGATAIGGAVTLCGGGPCRPMADKKAVFGAGGGGDTITTGTKGGGITIVVIENVSGPGIVNVNASGQTAGGDIIGAGAGGSISFYNKSSTGSPMVNLFAQGGGAGTAGGGNGGGGVIEKAACNSQQTGAVTANADATNLGGANPAANGPVFSINLEATVPSLCN